MKKIALSLLALMLFTSAGEQIIPKPASFINGISDGTVIEDFDGDGFKDIILKAVNSAGCAIYSPKKNKILVEFYNDANPKDFQSADFDGDGSYELYYKNKIYSYSEETPNSKN